MFAEKLKCYFVFLLAQTTESTQATDTGNGMSAKCSVVQSLDEWLMVEASMEKWESKMNVGKRRVLKNVW